MFLRFREVLFVFCLFEAVISFEVQYGAKNLIQIDENNDTLNITCTLTKEKINELGIKRFNKLFDYTANETKENEDISLSMEISSCADAKCVFDPSRKRTILNSTSIMATISKKEIKEALCFTSVKCWFDDRNTFLDEVKFITSKKNKPKPVQDFVCKFFNFEQVLCHWTGPQNCAYTSYNLTYTPRNHDITRTNHSTGSNPWLYDRICNDSSRNMGENFNYERGLREYSCTWKFGFPDKINNYDVANYYYFKLQISNELGYLRQDMTYVLYEHVISTAPYVLVYKITPHSISLLLGSRDPSAAPCTKYIGFIYQVSYKLEHEHQWKTENISFCSRQGVLFLKPNVELDDLRYANSKYIIKVVSVNTLYKGKRNGMSAATVVTVKTSPKLPDRPPDTTIGAFEFLEENTIRIYWKNILDTEKNGKAFFYHIEILEQNTHLNVSSESFFATFSNIKDQNYTFFIWSANEMGKSFNYSTIFIPGKKYRPKPPPELTQIFDSNKNEYLFVWQPPLDEIIENYTVFYCEVQNYLVHTACKKHWKWINLPSNTTHITVQEQNENHKFAISVNSKSSSSGIFRPQLVCTLFKSNFKDNLEIQVKEKNTTTVTVSWKPNCVGFTYTLRHCPIQSTEKSTCTKPEIEKNISHHKTNYTIERLEPDAFYALNLTITSALLTENMALIVRTTALNSGYLLIISMVLLGTLILSGTMTLLGRLKKHAKHIKIEPLLPPELSVLLMDSSLRQTNKEDIDQVKKIISTPNQENKSIDIKTANQLLLKSSVQYAMIISKTPSKNYVFGVSNEPVPLNEKEDQLPSQGYVKTPYIVDSEETINKTDDFKNDNKFNDLVIPKSSKTRNSKKVRFSYKKIVPFYFDKEKCEPDNSTKERNLEIRYNKPIQEKQLVDNANATMECYNKGYVTHTDNIPFKDKKQKDTESLNQNNIKETNTDDISYIANNGKKSSTSKREGYVTCADAIFFNNNKPALITENKTDNNKILDNKTFRTNNSILNKTTNNEDNCKNKIKLYKEGYVTCENATVLKNNKLENNNSFVMPTKDSVGYISMENLSDYNNTKMVNDSIRKATSKNISLDKLNMACETDKGYVTWEEALSIDKIK